jgi:L-amino acid N-acyltransferase YncA
VATGDQLHFRQATESDWPAIWPIFLDVISSGDTYAFPPDMSEEAARRMWLLTGSERSATYVVERDGRIVGTAYLKPNQIGLGDHVANAGWMIAPGYSGQGIGRRFAEYVIEQVRAVGFHGMQFNAVVATNTAAIALWESLGFTIVGTVPDAFRHSSAGLTSVHIMYRKL